MSNRLRNAVKPIERSIEDWLQDPDVWRKSYPPRKAEIFTARLSIDVTPELRSRIKLTAMQANCLASTLLRELLEREFPDPTINASAAPPTRAKKLIKESP